MKKSVPWEGAIIIHTSNPIDTALQLHLVLIQMQRMKIKDFLICHDKIFLVTKYFLALATFGMELDIP